MSRVYQFKIKNHSMEPFFLKRKTFNPFIFTLYLFILTLCLTNLFTKNIMATADHQVTENCEMYESLFMSPLKRIFVYGTLKRGEPNNGILLNTTNGYAKFLGIGKTLNKYPLVIATKYNIPFLLRQPGTGHQVLGELYDVDSKMLEKLDALEEHPTFYERTEEDVMMAKQKTDVNFDQVGCVTKAWTYFLPKFKPALLELPMLSNYSSEGNHGLKYAESTRESASPEDVM